MDSNKKDRSWFGNICSQIETMFQDVDNLAKKETVKFVTDQVHSVGDSVKRLYSDVVQDVLPSTEENLELLKGSETSSQVDTESHMESDTGTMTKPLSVTKEDKLLVEQGSLHALKNFNASEYCVAGVTDPPFPSPSQEILSCLLPSEDGDDIILNDADNTFEDYISKDVVEATANTDCNVEPSETYCNPKNIMLPMVTSLSTPSEEILATRKEMMEFSDDGEFHSNISTDGWLLHGLANIKAPNSNESTPMVVSAIEVCEENSLVVGSLLSSGHDADRRALNEDKTLCGSFPTEDKRLDVSSQTTESVSFYSSCGDEEAELGDVSSTCSASLETLNIVEFMTGDFTEQAENISGSHVESEGRPCTSSAPSSATSANETEVMDTLPAMDLNDPNPFSSSKSISNVGQSQSRQELCHEDAQSRSASSPCEAIEILPVLESNDLKSSTSKPVSIVHLPQRRPEHCHENAQSISVSSHSENGYSSEFGAGVIDYGMETIDLSNDVKYDGRDQVLNCYSVVPNSHRRRNFGYYKSLIKDAFASRKRLSKEYEHLGMWYGDIDMESRHNFELSSVRSFPPSVNEMRTESLDMCESDWELL